MTCPTGHAAYRFILHEGNRLAQCQACAHRWQVMLIGFDVNGAPRTDDIANSMTGVEWAEKQTRNMADMRRYQ